MQANGEGRKIAVLVRGRRRYESTEDEMGFWILLLLVLLLILALPTWPYSRRWGYGPTGGAVVLIVLFFILIWFGLVALSLPWAY